MGTNRCAPGRETTEATQEEVAEAIEEAEADDSDDILIASGLFNWVLEYVRVGFRACGPQPFPSTAIVYR